MASHIALSALLAVFPFLIFGAAMAAFLGADSFTETAIHLIFDTWPEEIASPLSDELIRVLTIPRGGLLTISVLAAAYFASNGVEALRIALNRAYRVSEPRAWYITRLVSLGYVLLAVVVLAFLSTLLVAVPIALRFAETWFPLMKGLLTTLSTWRIMGTISVLVIGLVVSHLGLPAGKRRLIDVLPGVCLTIFLWMIGGLIFTYYLGNFANYAATYAGLASIMIVIVFLYMIAVIFLIGAEVNAAFLKFSVIPAAVIEPAAADGLEPDETADVER
ncbi:membrane protein [Rhizobium halophytocola]|uniref:Membrane protein n=2 Tax=Rhizobium halophytocola TaxID=735519 RepID=A0ABS4E2K4_9HYPH|nr:membrane protein [Rhizobium halophytocola]